MKLDEPKVKKSKKKKDEKVKEIDFSEESPEKHIYTHLEGSNLKVSDVAHEILRNCGLKREKRFNTLNQCQHGLQSSMNASDMVKCASLCNCTRR